MDAEIGTIAAPETPVVESPTPETPESPTPESPTPETPAAELPTPEGEDVPLPGEPEDEPIETDARALDAKTRDTISSLKKMAQASTDPAQQKALAGAAKQLADAHFGRKAYEKEFPTVQAARQAKATLESLGGEEGITELQSEVQDYRTEIEQFSRGDRTLLEQLHKANPESTVTMLGHGIDLLTDAGNVEALDKVILRPMASRLKQAGFHSSVLKAAEFVKEGKGQEAYDQLGLIGDWLSKVDKAAGEIGTKAKTPDPREQEFQQREERLQQQERENTDRSIGEQVTRGNNAALTKVVEPFFKELKLTSEGRREFTQNLQAKVWAAMKADKVFQRQALAIKSKGDHARTSQFISAKFAELLPGIFRNYKNTLYPNLSRTAAPNGKAATAANGKQPAKAAAPAQPGAPVKVADVPKFDDVDWTKTPDSLWVSGKAHLKDKRFVTFY